VVNTIESKAMVLTFGLRSLDVLVSSLNQCHIPTISCSDGEGSYLGCPEVQRLAVERYQLILASLYGPRYIRGEVTIPEGISFAQLLREQDGPNKETPLVLFYIGDLTPALSEMISEVRRRNSHFPIGVPQNATRIFNLNSPEEWKALHELAAYEIRHSSRSLC